MSWAQVYASELLTPVSLQSQKGNVILEVNVYI